jgi:integrase
LETYLISFSYNCGVGERNLKLNTSGRHRCWWVLWNAVQLQTDIINKGLKPASNNKTLNILKHMFTKAIDWEMVESEAVKRIRKVKPLKDENRRLRYLSQQECQALINSCEAHLKPTVITALNTGMRKGEILNLKWENVDLKNGFILLNQDQTKNGERKEIPINRTLRETLQAITRRLDSTLCI